MKLAGFAGSLSSVVGRMRECSTTCDPDYGSFAYERRAPVRRTTRTRRSRPYGSKLLQHVADPQIERVEALTHTVQERERSRACAPDPGRFAMEPAEADGPCPRLGRPRGGRICL